MTLTDAEIRAEVLEDDKKKDVGVCVSVTLAFLAIAAGATGAGGVIVLRFLSIYRESIGGYWMACIPFIFPAVTGTSVAYKRMMMALGIHMTILLFASISAGASYGYSISPVWDERINCTQRVMPGDCEKPVLMYLYTIFGGAACAFSFLGVIITSCACHSSRKRIQKNKAMRELEEERNSQEEARRKALEAQGHQKVVIYNEPQKTPLTTEPNGVSKTNGDGSYIKQVVTLDDATTKL